MKVKCENVIVCGNYSCAWNHDGHCGQNVVALDASGKCALVKPRLIAKPAGAEPIPEKF